MKIKLFYSIVVLISVSLLFIASRNNYQYQADEKEVKIIDAFQRNYRSQNAIWWLTRDHKFLSQKEREATLSQLISEFYKFSYISTPKSEARHRK